MNAFKIAQRDAIVPPTHRTKEYDKYCKKVLDYIDDRIDEAIARQHATGSDVKQIKIIDELLKATQDRYTLKYLVLSIFSPAHDTVAITIGNAMFHLARNPECWAKLRAEVMPTATQPLTYELLNSFRYLNWVLRESQSLPIHIVAARLTCYHSSSSNTTQRGNSS